MRLRDWRTRSSARRITSPPRFVDERGGAVRRGIFGNSMRLDDRLQSSFVVVRDRHRSSWCFWFIPRMSFRSMVVPGRRVGRASPPRQGSFWEALSSLTRGRPTSGPWGASFTSWPHSKFLSTGRACRSGKLRKGRATEGRPCYSQVARLLMCCVPTLSSRSALRPFLSSRAFVVRV